MLHWILFGTQFRQLCPHQRCPFNGGWGETHCDAPGGETKQQSWPAEQQLPPQGGTPPGQGDVQAPVFGSHMSKEFGQQTPLQILFPAGQQEPLRQVSPGLQQLWPQTFELLQQVPFAKQVWPEVQQFEPHTLAALQQVPFVRQVWPVLQQLEPHALGAGQQVLPPTQVWPATQQFTPHAVRPAEQQRVGLKGSGPGPAQVSPGPQQPLLHSTGQQGEPEPPRGNR